MSTTPSKTAAHSRAAAKAEALAARNERLRAVRSVTGAQLAEDEGDGRRGLSAVRA